MRDQAHMRSPTCRYGEMSRLIPYGVSAWGEPAVRPVLYSTFPIRWAHPTQRNAVLYQLSVWNVRAVSMPDELRKVI